MSDVWQEVISNSEWFQPILPIWEQFQAWPSLVELNQLATSGLKFIPQLAKNKQFEKQYESSIYLRGEIQTRPNNWHDFFNACVWLQFEQSKRAINAKHFAASRGRHLNRQSLRSPIENKLTHFDETGGVVISTDQHLLQLIKDHQWQALFVENRNQLNTQLRVIIFGHALYEKMLNPYVGMTANCLMFQHNTACELDYAAIDKMLSESLLNDFSETTTLWPLPILGMPGWYLANEDATFYQNSSYFRAKQERKNDDCERFI